jgi:SRSO17 transposase
MDERQVWSAGLAALLERVAPLFATERSRKRVARYVDGLLADVERKIVWQLAEQAGEATPYAMQQFLFRGTWDADGLCRHMRGY